MRPIETPGTVSTSAAIPAFQPKPSALEHAERKYGSTDGKYMLRTVLMKEKSYTRASSRKLRSVLFIPAETLLHTTGKTISAEMSTGT